MKVNEGGCRPQRRGPIVAIAIEECRLAFAERWLAKVELADLLQVALSADELRAGVALVFQPIGEDSPQGHIVGIVENSAENAYVKVHRESSPRVVFRRRRRGAVDCRIGRVPCDKCPAAPGPRRVLCGTRPAW